MKTFYLIFGTGNPQSYTGLSPTFIVFSANGLTTVPAPAITESPTGSGIYKFIYGPTLSTVFVADGGSALNVNDRYISAALDPIQAVDESVGNPADSFGTSSTDPATLMGYAKRAQEFNEGDANYNKSTGVWTIYDRTAGVTLAVKTLTNDTTQATKS